MVGEQIEQTEKEKVVYHVLGACNVCGSDDTKVEAMDFIDNTICEAEVECNMCGNQDYWANGFYQSMINGHNKAE